MLHTPILGGDRCSMDMGADSTIPWRTILYKYAPDTPRYPQVTLKYPPAISRYHSDTPQIPQKPPRYLRLGCLAPRFAAACRGRSSHRERTMNTENASQTISSRFSPRYTISFFKHEVVDREDWARNQPMTFDAKHHT